MVLPTERPAGQQALLSALEPLAWAWSGVHLRWRLLLPPRPLIRTLLSLLPPAPPPWTSFCEPQEQRAPRCATACGELLALVLGALAGPLPCAGGLMEQAASPQGPAAMGCGSVPPPLEQAAPSPLELVARCPGFVESPLELAASPLELAGEDARAVAARREATAALLPGCSAWDCDGGE